MLSMLRTAGIEAVRTVAADEGHPNSEWANRAPAQLAIA